MWKIENADELMHLISQLKSNAEVNLDKVELALLKQVKIKIEGDPLRYNGTINFAICKAICEFQNEVWRTFAEIKTGVPNISYLTQPEKDQLEIAFTINAGCTEIIADLTELLKAGQKFIKEVTNGMTGNQKVFTCVALALCVSGTIVANTWSNNAKEVETEKTEAQKLNDILTTIKDVANSSNTPRFKQSIQAVEEHTEKGYSEVVRAVADAKQVTISQDNTEIKLESAQLKHISDKLNAQEKAKTEPEQLDLYIDGVKRQEGKITIFARTVQNEVFNANLDPDMLGEEGINQIIDRVKDFNTIKLNGMVKRRAGKIEQASFSSIVTE